MILFQPCPYHFPELWKVASPTIPELTPEQLQAVRELYQFPDDDSPDAQLYFAKPSVLAQVYAKLWFQDPHGFLVEDGRLVLLDRGIAYIESSDHLRLNAELNPNFKPSDECFQRAKNFELPEETPRRGFPGGLAHGQMRRSVCVPCARETWPST